LSGILSKKILFGQGSKVVLWVWLSSSWKKGILGESIVLHLS
jgi:hypothetical protein